MFAAALLEKCLKFKYIRPRLHKCEKQSGNQNFFSSYLALYSFNIFKKICSSRYFSIFVKYKLLCTKCIRSDFKTRYLPLICMSSFLNSLFILQRLRSSAACLFGEKFPMDALKNNELEEKLSNECHVSNWNR